MTLLTYNKHGFVLIDTYQCNIYKELLVKCSSKEIKHKGKKGRSSSEINKATSVTIFTGTIFYTNIIQFFSRVGIVHPKPSAIQYNNKHLK